MKFKLDTKRPYGTIAGTLDDAPKAKYVQDKMYFDTRGCYIMDTDGTKAGEASLAEKDLIPEEDTSGLVDILKMKAAKIPAHLLRLSDDDLGKLLTMAHEQKRHKAVIAAIEYEVSARAAASASSK